jgi:hypothetical protein
VTRLATLASLILLLGAGATSPVRAQQGVIFTAGRVLAGDPEEASWHITVQRDLIGPIGVDGSVMVLPGARPARGQLYGLGADLTLFAGSRGFPTVLIGAAFGAGFGQQKRLWGGGSVGLRMPVAVLGSIRVMAEGRWRNLSVDDRDGFEVGVALGWRPRGVPGQARPDGSGLWVPPATADLLRTGGIPETKARLLGNIVATAVEEMGQPYVWGGTGNGSGGFDCSGLIQYAYSRYGIGLPRTAQGQSGAGIEIRRDLDALLPGDILTFSEHGDQVTHVGLYVGDGRFIHSASNGVRLSRLNDDDPEGKWWFRRWVGVRRVVE